MITLEIDDQPLRQALQRLSGQLDDLSPVMEKIAGDLQSAVEQNFATEGERIGHLWKKSRRAIQQGGKTLQDTGRLAGSITKETGRDYAMVGTNVIYAAMMQFGGKKSQFPHLWGDIPARPYLGLNADDEEDIRDKISKALQKAIG